MRTPAVFFLRSQVHSLPFVYLLADCSRELITVA